MPSYLPPLQGVSLSVAEAEAAAIAPVQRAMLDALEFWHPAFTQAARVVNDKADLVATLEATAPRNPGATVTFTAVGVRVTWPAETGGGDAPKMQLVIDGVSAVLTEQLDRAVGSLVPVELIARRYASDDTSGPARLPVLRLELTEVSVTDTQVSATLSHTDPANRRFPSVAYTVDRYPGLSA